MVEVIHLIALRQRGHEFLPERTHKVRQSTWYPFIQSEWIATS